MLTKNRRNSSTLGQVPRCLRVSKPFPTALLALARHCSQGVADSHSTLTATWRWKTEALRGEEIPKAPRAVAGSWSPGLYCYPVAALPVTCRPTGPIFTPLFSAPPRQMFPLLECSSQHSQLVALSLYSFSVPCFLLRKISQLSQFNIYDAYVCWLIYCLNYIMCYVLTRTHLFCSHRISNAKHNAWLQQTCKFSSNDW